MTTIALTPPLTGFAWVGRTYLPVVAHAIEGPLFAVVGQTDFGLIAGATDVIDNAEGAAMEVADHLPEATPNSTRRALGLKLLIDSCVAVSAAELGGASKFIARPL